MPDYHAIEIAKRPPRTWPQSIPAIIFSVVFALGCIMVNLSQFVVLLPLRFLPFAFADSIYHAGIRLSKGSFGTLLSQSFFLLYPPLSPHFFPCPVLMSQCFAPTRLSITFERNGPGAFSQDEIDNIAVRGSNGRILALKLPQKSILVANHQVRT